MFGKGRSFQKITWKVLGQTFWPPHSKQMNQISSLPVKWVGCSVTVPFKARFQTPHISPSLYVQCPCVSWKAPLNKMYYLLLQARDEQKWQCLCGRISHSLRETAVTSMTAKVYFHLSIYPCFGVFFPRHTYTTCHLTPLTESIKI